MAGKAKGNGKEKLWTKQKWKGFVNLRLSQEEKKAIKESVLEEAAGLEFLMDAATAGYKCSISYSIPEDVYTVSLTGQYQEKPNGGITMSLRHRELMTALSGIHFLTGLDGLSVDWAEKYMIAGDDDW